MADGLLLRVRVPGGRLTAAQAWALAEVAAHYGSGTLDVTRRANVQIRGLAEGGLAPVQAALAEARLAPRDPRSDRMRNILASPLDAHAMALTQALDAAIETNAARWPALPVKASVVVDGGRGDAIHTAHDLGFLARGDGRWDVSHRGRLVGRSIAEAHAPALLTAVFEAMNEAGSRDVPLTWPADLPFEPSNTIAAPCAPLAPGIPSPDTLIAAPHLGRCTSEALAGLADLAEDGWLRLASSASGGVIALAGLDDASRTAAHADALGFRTAPGPRVIACAGRTGCARTDVDTKADAARLLAKLDAAGLALGDLTVHLSGCPRGCAFSQPADLLALGDGAGYALHEAARADTSNAPFAHITGADLPGVLIARLTKRMEAA